MSPGKAHNVPSPQCPAPLAGLEDPAPSAVAHREVARRGEVTLPNFAQGDERTGCGSQGGPDLTRCVWQLCQSAGRSG